MTLKALFLALLLAPGARARYPAEGRDFDHEVLALLGWSKDCSIALTHYGFPYIGEAIAAEPTWTRVGTISIPPGKDRYRFDWRHAAAGKFTWDPKKVEKAKRELRREGYVLAGHLETLRDAPVVDDRDLPRLILSTDTLKPETLFDPTEEEGFRLALISYSPVDLCAVLVYERREGPKAFFRPLLVRLGNPVSRKDRALAHTTNGLLLHERGDSVGALAETGIAAQMSPEEAFARYAFGAQLALAGKTAEALAELEAAVTLDPAYKKKARGDLDWDSLRRLPRFKDLTR